MTNDRVIASWSESGYAAQWQQADGMSAMLRLPWAIATTLVGQEREPKLVVDVGSGPGTFLAALLEAYPEARGVWIDASPDMKERAAETLAPYAGRVEYVVGDAAELSTMEPARNADVVLNSRVAHHFDRPGLEAFYRDAAGLLVPGGWLVTLDHILPPGDWDRRYRDVLPIFAGPNAGKPSHPHYFPFPSMTDHLDALAGAGLTDADLAWRAFYTCLYVARKAS
ncbi:class I SAM-dependent methyltransferase [Jiangella mangrovi]|uniref:SAM-dependent methyltransferase n=1 Tax=Jiangella mangrovi TaxID=1524084 RepID=A0A7W9LLK3_9ACTN|nr:class I SAM-dependent methyltransferase [Jiangella mangrovi]MBB5788246.1 SAM-dependent methyltransferase [Jiangella mangrovi]